MVLLLKCCQSLGGGGKGVVLTGEQLLGLQECFSDTGFQDWWCQEKHDMQNGDLLMVCLTWFFIFFEPPWIWQGKNYLCSRLKPSKNLCQIDVNSEMYYVAWKLCSKAADKSPHTQTGVARLRPKRRKTQMNWYNSDPDIPNPSFLFKDDKTENIKQEFSCKYLILVTNNIYHYFLPIGLLQIINLIFPAPLPHEHISKGSEFCSECP